MDSQILGLHEGKLGKRRTLTNQLLVDGANAVGHVIAAIVAEFVAVELLIVNQQLAGLLRPSGELCGRSAPSQGDGAVLQCAGLCCFPN